MSLLLRSSITFFNKSSNFQLITWCWWCWNNTTGLSIIRAERFTELLTKLSVILETLDRLELIWIRMRRGLTAICGWLDQFSNEGCLIWHGDPEDGSAPPIVASQWYVVRAFPMRGRRRVTYPGLMGACFIAVYTYAVLTPTPAVNEPIRKQSCGNYTETVLFLGTALVFLFCAHHPLVHIHRPRWLWLGGKTVGGSSLFQRKFRDSFPAGLEMLLLSVLFSLPSRCFYYHILSYNITFLSLKWFNINQDQPLRITEGQTSRINRSSAE